MPELLAGSARCARSVWTPSRGGCVVGAALVGIRCRFIEQKQLKNRKQQATVGAPCCVRAVGVMWYECFCSKSEQCIVVAIDVPELDFTNNMQCGCLH